MGYRANLLLGTVLALSGATLFVEPAEAQSGPVYQSGTVTPTHVVCWTTNGIVQDCNPSTGPAATIFGVLSSATKAIFVDDAKLTSGGGHEFTIGINPVLGYMSEQLETYGTDTCIPRKDFIGAIGYMTVECSGTVLIPNLATGAGITAITAATGLTALPTNPITSIGTIEFASINTGDMLANITGTSAAPTPVTGSQYYDATFGATIGDVPQRGFLTWTSTNGMAGQVYESSGPGALNRWVSAIPAGTSGQLLGASGTAGLAGIVAAGEGLTVITGALDVTGIPAATAGNLLCATGAVGTAEACPEVTQSVFISLAQGMQVVTNGTTIIAVGFPWTSTTITGMGAVTAGSSTPTYDVAGEINATTITSCGAIASAASIALTTCTGANVVGASDTLELVVTNAGGTAQLAGVRIDYTHTVP